MFETETFIYSGFSYVYSECSYIYNGFPYMYSECSYIYNGFSMIFLDIFPFNDLQKGASPFIPTAWIRPTAIQRHRLRLQRHHRRHHRRDLGPPARNAWPEVPSGYVNIAIENDHRNSGCSH